MKTASGRHSLIAAHADRRESDLIVIPKETLDLWKATGRVTRSAAGRVQLGDQGDKKPWGLWPYLIAVIVRSSGG